MTEMIPGVRKDDSMIRRQHRPELRTCIVQRSGLQELHLTLLPHDLLEVGFPFRRGRTAPWRCHSGN